MDTQNHSTADVPTFKLAKVGKERKRGAAWFGGGSRGAGSGFRIVSGGSSGAGVAVGSGAVSAKILTILLVSTVASFGSSRLGAVLRGDSKHATPAEQRVFAAKDDGDQKYDDLSGVIKGERSIPNSLGYLSGSIDGLTPEERAKKAADEAAARAAEEEAQKKADEEAAKQEAPMPPAMPADAAALMAGKGKPGLKNFNKLSSSFGGSAGGSKLSGGAGLSGGVTRGFAAPSVKSPSNVMSAFKGGAKTNVARASRASSRPSRSRGFAKRQLLNANRLSRQATGTGKAETSAEAASEAFYGGSAAGTSIEGAGVAGGLSTGGDSEPMGGYDGGPVGGGVTDCGAGQHLNENGVCVDTVDPNTANACKYQSEIDLIKTLFIAIAICALISSVLQYMGWLAAVATALKYAIVAMGAVICGLGIKIATMDGGDFMIGAILGAAGAYVAYQAWVNVAVETVGEAMVTVAAETLIATAVGGLTAASAGAPSND
ncbi:MAG: hypothetical protein A2506_08645 [Elusimicrobia bacterium RIFOXYD12_FULL_66_9]|nr:MAG: hypothetical protein A2506_08645 [Elusimicrobia bacterium RIFOXYD12_FULL_66_9]